MISDEIDYSSDTSENDSNVVDKEMNKIYKKVLKHKIINKKYDSSDSEKKYLNSKNF